MLRTFLYKIRSRFCIAVIVPKHKKACVIKNPKLKKARASGSTPDYKSSHQVIFQPLFHKTFSAVGTRNLNLKMSEISPDSVLKPPTRVNGMTKLDRTAFDHHVKVLAVRVPVSAIGQILKHMKKIQLKMIHVKSVVELEKSDPEFRTHRLVLVDPREAAAYDCLPEQLRKILTDNGITDKDFREYDLKLMYQNWNLSEILRAVIPDDVDAVSGYSEVGHIAHFNLRNEVLPYKQLIDFVGNIRQKVLRYADTSIIAGEVLLDKQPNVKTVVNKLNTIDSTYRNFQMELLAGQDNYVTTTKENGCVFELDFSKVYWNSRLGTEHERIVKKISAGDVLFDVFAGIGPFSIPSAKKKATVFANDLNPASHECLVRNTKLNKLKDNIKCYNLDGRVFISTVVKEELVKIYQQDNEFPLQDSCAIHIVMNLPALAWTFLDAFCSLLPDSIVIPETMPLPVVNCYCFTDYDTAANKHNGDMTEEVRQRIGGFVQGLDVEQVTARFVRNVAPRKDMMCVTFILTQQILCGASVGKIGQVPQDSDEPPAKCMKMD